MQLKDKVIVITGAGSGIGRALVARFSQEQPKQIVAVDINFANAQQTAKLYHCVAMEANVSSQDDLTRVIDTTEQQFGEIDLFCSNAGIAMGESEQSPLDQWQLSWDVNVMSHVLAARILLPRMTKRGSGYFLNTASAAGLLNQIGGAAYGVTKHAAVGFGEWLALTYRHQGICVSMLCPQAVKTAMTMTDSDQESIQAAAVDGMMEPEELAEVTVQGLSDEQFLILPHAEVATYMQRKTADYDRWISGMNRLHLKINGET